MRTEKRRYYRHIFSILTCLSVLINGAFPTCASNTFSIESSESMETNSQLVSQDVLAPSKSAGTKYEVEPNNTYYAADSTQDDYDNYGTISKATDIDWWQVSFNQSGYANFWLGNIPSGCNYELELYAYDGSTRLSYSHNTGNSSELISAFWVTKNTEYYIKIYSNTGYSQSKYKFRTKNYPYHRYAGITKSGYNKGISATIRVPYSLPNVSDSGVSAWVSTAELNYYGTPCWIQTGAKYYYDQSSFKTYIEYFQGGVMHHAVYNNQSLGTTRTYKVEHEADGKWHAYVADVEKISCVLSQNSCTVQAKGEVHKENIQMGPFYFTSVKTKTTSDSWVDNTATPYADSPYYVTGSATSFTVNGP